MYLSALIPLEPNWSQILSFSAMGFCVVMLVLFLLSLATSLIGLGFVVADKQKVAKPAQGKSVAKSADIPEDHALAISAAVASVMPDISKDAGELLAVITAAAAVALEEEEFRVVSFKPVDFNYARHGREQIFSAQNYTPLRNK